MSLPRESEHIKEKKKRSKAIDIGAAPVKQPKQITLMSAHSWLQQHVQGLQLALQHYTLKHEQRHDLPNVKKCI